MEKVINVQLKKRPISGEIYSRMIEHGILTEDDKVELINGDIIEMSPIGSLHFATVNRLNRLFVQTFGERAIVSIQNPINLDENSIPEPDVVLFKWVEDEYQHEIPTSKDTFLIVEVSQSSLELDREIKAPLYAQANIPQYWIVNLVENRIEVYRNPVNGTYRNIEIVEKNEMVKVDALDQELPTNGILPE